MVKVELYYGARRDKNRFNRKNKIVIIKKRIIDCKGE